MLLSPDIKAHLQELQLCFPDSMLQLGLLFVFVVALLATILI